MVLLLCSRRGVASPLAAMIARQAATRAAKIATPISNGTSRRPHSSMSQQPSKTTEPPPSSSGRVRLADVLENIFAKSIIPSVEESANSLFIETERERDVPPIVGEVVVPANERLSSDASADAKSVRNPMSVRPKWRALVNRLVDYRLPALNEIGEAIVTAEMSAANVALLRNVVPLIDAHLPKASIVERSQLLEMMSRRNVRADLDFIQRVYDTFTNESVETIGISQLSRVAASVAQLGVYHEGIIRYIIAGLDVELKHTPARYSIMVGRIAIALSHLRVGDARVWEKLAEWTCANSKLIETKNMCLLLKSFAMANIPRDLFLTGWERPFDTLSPKMFLTYAYAATECGALTHFTVNRLLSERIINSLLPELMNVNDKTNILLNSSFCYNFCRLWSIISAANLNLLLPESENSEFPIEKYAGWRKRFAQFLKSHKELEALFWQMKYSRDTSAIDSFRRLLHGVAPLGTHASAPYIDTTCSVHIEADVLVHRSNIVKIGTKKAKRLAVVFFADGHTTHPESMTLEELKKLRLTGPSQLAVNLLCARHANEGGPWPVVIAQHELNALPDDDRRRELIRRRVVNLSNGHHKPIWRE